MSRSVRVLSASVLAAALAGAAGAAEWDPLLTPDELSSLVEDAGEDLVLVDLRSTRDYAKGHVDGAVNVPYHAWRGPEENPGRLIDEEKLTLNLQQLGVEPDTPVVITYDGDGASDFGAAARVYWTMRSAGIERIAILNGGVRAWRAAGKPLATTEDTNLPSDVRYSFSDRWLATEEEVEAIVAGESDAMLVDARPTSFFLGKKKHDAARWAGTLAGAVNLDQFAWFGAEDEGKPAPFEADADAILDLAKEAGWTPDKTIVSFCNTGHWAATNWFALSEVAGIEAVKLYPESMVGWTLTHALN